uniref:chorismate transformation enzyme, FkbO/Hyg5 family n=1 Tax=uncultured Draconibacterium sp. TaxID=1573823 RepID=UPI0032173711
MYFLDGDRIYIKPGQSCGSIDEQLSSCLLRLKQINSGKEIFQLNFFVDAESDAVYNSLLADIRSKVTAQFPNDILINLIAQPPLTCKIIVEAFYYDPSKWASKTIKKGDSAGILFQKENTEILIGNVQSDQKKGYRNDAENTFFALNELLEVAEFPVKSIVRQWNYLKDIIGFDGDKQNYQEFNNVRSEFYKDYFEAEGYPAATGIGTNRGGVIIEFVAVKSEIIKTAPVDNPDQIAAHHYSNKVLVGEECLLKTTPKFERARYIELFDKKLMFISGTASITGEKTIGVGDPVLQTEITIQNIKRLYADDVLQKLSKEKLEAKYGHARVYVKNRKDFAAIRNTFKKHFGNLPVVYIIADICRDDLLVEIEGKVILE